VNELPKSVRDELARQQHSGSQHPDADLLTAFSEGTVTAAERAKLEQHLASCSECREVIFLAVPRTDSATPAVIAAPRTRNRWFPAWAPWAAAAGILVVASITLTRELKTPSEQASLRKNEQTSAPALRTTPPPTPSPTQDTLRQAPPPAVGTLTAAPKAVVPSLDMARAKDKQALAGRRDEELADKKDNFGRKELKSLPTESVVADSAKAEAGAVAQQPANAPIVAGQLYEYHGARNTTLKPGPAAPAQNQMVQNQQNQIPQNAAIPSASQTVEVTSQAAPLQKSRTEDLIATGPALTANAKVATHWRITSDGKLERLSNRNWTTGLVQPGTKFTAVAVIGPIVWTGGTHGALYRSVDGGATFAPIQLPNVASGSDPTIAHIEFRDAWNGTVSTADKRSWTTRDRGETWLQP